MRASFLFGKIKGASRAYVKDKRGYAAPPAPLSTPVAPEDFGREKPSLDEQETATRHECCTSTCVSTAVVPLLYSARVVSTTTR